MAFKAALHRDCGADAGKYEGQMCRKAVRRSLCVVALTILPYPDTRCYSLWKSYAALLTV